jgi:hypothetical protein
MSKQIITYRFISDGGVLLLHVEGEDDWTEDMYDSVAEDELASMVIEPLDWYIDDASN